MAESGDANANDKGSAARNTAGPDKVQTIGRKIKALFKEAVQALLARVQDKPQPERQREKEGERDGGLMQFALRFARRLGARQKTGENAEIRYNFRAAEAALTQAEETDDLFKKPGAHLFDEHDPASPFFNQDALYASELDESFVEQQDYSLNL